MKFQKSILKTVFTLLVSFSGLLILSAFTSETISAQPFFDVSEYNVEITINEDATMQIREEIKQEVNGTFNGLRRDIPLNNIDPRCDDDSPFSCGGFDLLLPIGIYDESGNEPDTGTTRYYIVTDEVTGERFFRFEWEIYEGGSDVDDERWDWSVEYLIYGGNAWFTEGSEYVPYFYWNLLPTDKPSLVDESNIEVFFPDSVLIQDGRVSFFTNYDYTYKRNRSSNSIELNLRDVSQYGDFTMAYRFAEGELLEPVRLTYDVIRPDILTGVVIDGYDIEGAPSTDTLNLFPPGERVFEFKHIGYETERLEVDLEPGSSRTIEVELEPLWWMAIIISLNQIGIVLGIFSIPVGLIVAYNRYRKQGVDINMPKTIVPIYKIPEGMMPYLMGSLKDEKVDLKDITGSVIGLAYKRYLKIKEIKKGKNYELTKLDDSVKKRGEIDKIEEELLDILFSSKDTIETKSISQSTVKKLIELEDTIYGHMVNLGYFNKSPKATRTNNVGIGIGVFIVGVALAVAGSVALSAFIGVLTVFTFGLGLAALGLGILISSRFMPQKTELGSKKYAELLGFKMYLETAERYRVQDLTPDTFEKFLPYAIVFGVEEKWAEKFEGIYDRQPDWYEGSGNITNAILLSNFATSFSSATTQKFTSLARSSGASGSGWSGGGSFGGFSGGGGGGGSAGGW